MYTFTETVVCSIQELQREFCGVHITPNGKFALVNGVVHITPHVTWYNDMAILYNLPSLQLNKYLYHLCTKVNSASVTLKIL